MAIDKMKFEKGIYIFSGIVLVFIIALISMVKQENRKLLKEGIRADARIINKNESGRYSRKGRSKKYSKFDLAFFADTAQQKTDTILPKSNDINDKIDAIFDNIAAQRVTGDYTSATLTVSSSSYNKYKIGDKIKVIYYKDKPESAKLLSEVE